MLESFIDERLNLFGSQRNDPNAAALSQMSPWIRFGESRSSSLLVCRQTRRTLPVSVSSGHMSAQRVALQVQRSGKKAGVAVSSFIEELVVRRELTDNFCFYNKNYDSVEGQCGSGPSTRGSVAFTSSSGAFGGSQARTSGPGRP